MDSLFFMKKNSACENTKALTKSPGLFVPEAGIEPARVLPHWFLRPTRLPVPPLGLLSPCVTSSPDASVGT